MSSDLNAGNRDWLVQKLRSELVGPDPSGEPIEISENQLLSWSEFRKPKRQVNGEEILWQDSPLKRYGCGVLFPRGIAENDQLKEEADSAPADDVEQVDNTASDDEVVVEGEALSDLADVEDVSDNFDVSLANEYKPSAMGLSFLVDVASESKEVALEVHIECAKYKKVAVRCGDSVNDASNRYLWLREPITQPNGSAILVPITSVDLLKCPHTPHPVPMLENEMSITVVSRKCQLTKGKRSHRLVTVCLVNDRIKSDSDINEQCFFQCGLRVLIPCKASRIQPYPSYEFSSRRPDDDLEITRLLYRDRITFAIGHGCAADWNVDESTSHDVVRTDCVPTFETPAFSADVVSINGAPIRPSMRKLAGLDTNDSGDHELDELISAYSSWVQGLESSENQKSPIPEDLLNTAEVLSERRRECLVRIEDGLRFLRSESQDAEIAREAFRLTNHAMLIVQLRMSRDVRLPSWKDDRWEWSSPIPEIDASKAHPEKGYWRAFQIAFLLMSLRGICDPQHPDRGKVDLIWFPTGGGKTEAYLGLTAFTIFFNRLRGEDVKGSDVLMRYTLRLLTAQQFQRAGLLFCAMEYLRLQSPNLERLGETEFKIGMWVGGSATPNKRSEARASLKDLRNNKRSENPFVLLKCPWCNSQFGPTDPLGKSDSSVHGYVPKRLPNNQETVVFQCADAACEFGSDPKNLGKPCLPITVIDEDIFESPPNLVIGTVDKFALLAWKPEIRSIFGIDGSGERRGIPPSLIIQDELHLISGPLGSMVGAYETVIEELCSMPTENGVTKPKIVASTATISRAREQILALYGRNETTLFPPSGLNASDSFFSREMPFNSDEGGQRGRLYMGVFAPAHGSLQTTIARTFACLLQYPAVMPIVHNEAAERDPWWTLIAFFNSLRELGSAATLLVADVRDYLRVLIDRHGYDYRFIRQLLNWTELTSRRRSDQIPSVIQSLETRLSAESGPQDTKAIDACLASNIIEVGIDIDRLALMSITGQPKTTSQYIQVSSRVGRSWDAPGLITTLYSTRKPRDRSHFEGFRPYHEKLYANVEPTSVTPWSRPAVERALHGLIVAFVRQMASDPVSEKPRPYPLNEMNELRESIRRMIQDRVDSVDLDEREHVRQLIQRRMKEWEAWDPKEYGGFGMPPEDPPLMHPAGSISPTKWRGHSWPTLSSLRDVDSSCEAEITRYYNQIGELD